MKRRLLFSVVLGGVILGFFLVFVASKTRGYDRQSVSGEHRLSGPTAAIVYVPAPTLTVDEQVCQAINSGKVKYTFGALVNTLGPPQKVHPWSSGAPDGRGAM